VNGRLECFNVDHIIPKACGGNNSFFNLQLTCEKCNSEKGNSFDMEMVHSERLKRGGTRRAHNILVLRQRDELAKQVASLTEQLKEARRPQTFREVLENKLRRLIPTGYWS
jgi:CRISPR/Cas system Type II protein with McrA/HNH and RuvC-like nuclease domain